MAAVLWEALVGVPCFHGDGDAETYGLVLAGAVDPPSRHRRGLPPGLDAVVMKGLATDPGRRFATAREMADALQRALPPAFPTEVGAWVERVAHEGLTRRAAIVADIERRGSAGPDSGATPTFDPLRDVVSDDDDEPTVASQPSSLSVETPKRVLVTSVPPPGTRFSTGLAAGMAAGGVVVGGIAMLLLVRGPDTPKREPPAAERSGSPAAVVAVAPPPSSPPAAVPSAGVPQPSAVAVDVPDASGPIAAPLPARPAPHSPGRHPAATPAPSADWPLSHDRR
jgi:eukaryotic-like serine/threonine-protein kinase